MLMSFLLWQKGNSFTIKSGAGVYYKSLEPLAKLFFRQKFFSEKHLPERLKFREAKL